MLRGREQDGSAQFVKRFGQGRILAVTFDSIPSRNDGRRIFFTGHVTRTGVEAMTVAIRCSLNRGNGRESRQLQKAFDLSSGFERIIQMLLQECGADPET